MPADSDQRVRDLPDLRDRRAVFRDRIHAGEIVATMLAEFRRGDAVVLAIPAGGVPVGKAIATALALDLDVAVVSKILLPWTSEAGYGAVAFDGRVWVDADAVARFGLSEDDVREGTRKARDKVERRVRRLRGGRPLTVRGHTAIVVDDGIAAGSTMRAAVAALRAADARRLVVAVPTGHAQSLQALAAEVDAVFCANVRHGYSFAVADAYQRWADLTDEEVVEALSADSGSQGTTIRRP